MGVGVGDLLVSAVTTWAQEVGAEVVVLAVADGNQAASSLYERHGFARTGESRPMPDGERREFVMARTVASGSDVAG